LIDPQTEAVGHLKWVIYAMPSQELVLQGDRVITNSDITLFLGGPAAHKRISLCEKFCFSLAGGPEKAVDAGFGISARHNDHPSFGWNWFVVDSPGHAVTEPGMGELAIERIASHSGSQIGRMEFLADTYLQIARRRLPIHHDWRIVIFAGSWIAWPPFVENDSEAVRTGE
jgi:hypothetical protein